MNTGIAFMADRPPFRTWWIRFAAVSLATFSLSGLIAATAAGVEPDHGFQAGPWLLEPSLLFEYEYHSNPFFRPTGGSSDRILTAKPALGLSLPFSQSLVYFNISKAIYDYQRVTLGGNSVLESSGGVELNFNTQDKLELDVENTSGLARSTGVFDEGGETVFRGDTFDFNSYTATFSRSVYGHRGYRVQLQRQDLVFDRGTTVQFFDYRGWNYQGEYRQPVSPVSWFLVSLGGRKYDHFRVGDVSPDPFRREDSRIGYLGFDARYSPRSGLRVLLGYGSFEYPGSGGSSFGGLVADLTARHSTGSGKLEWIVSASRKPYSSFFRNNTHYVRDFVEVSLIRHFSGKSLVRLRTNVSWSDYSDRLEAPADPQNGILRNDRTASTELYARISLSSLLGLRISVLRSRRSSNYIGVEYEATRIFSGLALGWF